MPKFEIVTADIIDWAASYDGPKFHAVLSDPPYGLEFMGKEWDSPQKFWEQGANFTPPGIGERDIPWPSFSNANAPNRTCATCGGRLRGKKRCRCEQPDWKPIGTRKGGTVAPWPPPGNLGGFADGNKPSFARQGDIGRKYQEWCEQWAAVLLPELHPGAVSLFFGGTRMWHRLACGIEDAGFEMWDTIMWLYGCLSEDTEILVNGLWEPYHRAIKGSHALCYEVDSGKFSWQPIENVHIYDYSDTAYRIQSDYTDQIVSRNHRCVVERGGRRLFQVAECAAEEKEVCVPVLEDVQGLLDSLSYGQPPPSTKECLLLDEMRRQSSQTSKTSRRPPGDDQDNLPSVREREVETTLLDEASSDSDMLAEMQWKASRSRVEIARQQGQGRVDGKESGVLSHQDDGPKQPGLDGRGHVPPQPRELQAGKVRALPKGVCGDGREGRIRYGTSPDGRSGNRQVFDEEGSRPSREPRFSGQPDEELQPVCVQPGPQVVRKVWKTRTDLARITSIQYVGKMWCVSVPTGAFVVRRNGKVFITGNSGMPKALDVSKLIDKRNKDERGVVGYDASRARPNRVDNTGYDDAGKVPSDRSDNGATITAPASAESAPWSGHKTCSLKPAWEPVLCFKAPMGGRTYAELATGFGSGALNVDGARVAADDGAQEGGGREGEASADRSYAEEGSTDFAVRPGPRGGDARGRYPANLVLGCICRETGLVDAPVCGDVSGEEPSQRMGGKGIYGRSDERPPFEAYRGKAVVHTDPGCPCRMLDAQTGDLGRSAGGHSGHEEAYCGGYGEEEHYGGLLPGYGDAGGASRFFYQAKATRREREVGLLGLVPCHKCGELGSRKHANPKTGKEEKCVRNDHPTVKPVALCRWLATLLLPPASASPRRLLIPFSGSGSEVVGALLAGWDEVVGVEMDPRYSEIARRRCEAALRGEYDAIAKEDEG